jgi:hypothetical protein
VWNICLFCSIVESSSFSKCFHLVYLENHSKFSKCFHLARDGPRQFTQTYGFSARNASEEEEESAAAQAAAAAAAAATAEAAEAAAAACCCKLEQTSLQF